jgi:hypothetical protein
MDEANQLGAKWDKDKKQLYIAPNNPNKEQMLAKWSKAITFSSSSQNNKSLFKFFNPAFSNSSAFTSNNK